jgi:Helix-turn-helix domain
MNSAMRANHEIRETQPAKRSAFTIMNNIRDHCDQPSEKKVLMFSIGLYANADGTCYPSNETLAIATRKSSRTVQRMLSELRADGELEILTPGIGRAQKRIIRLTKYVAISPEMPLGGGDIKGDTAMSCLNTTRLLGKTSCNNHRNSQKKRTHHSLRSASLNGVCVIEDEKLLTGKEQAAIRHFNELLPAHGFAPVTKVSTEITNVLGRFDPDIICELVDSVANGTGDCCIPKRKTLVRLCWENLL